MRPYTRAFTIYVYSECGAGVIRHPIATSKLADGLSAREVPTGSARPRRLPRRRTPLGPSGSAWRRGGSRCCASRATVRSGRGRKSRRAPGWSRCWAPEASCRPLRLSTSVSSRSSRSAYLAGGSPVRCSLGRARQRRLPLAQSVSDCASLSLAHTRASTRSASTSGNGSASVASVYMPVRAPVRCLFGAAFRTSKCCPLCHQRSSSFADRSSRGQHARPTRQLRHAPAATNAHQTHGTDDRPAAAAWLPQPQRPLP